MEGITKRHEKGSYALTKSLQIKSWLNLLGSHFNHQWDKVEFEKASARLAKENMKSVERAISRCFEECNYFPHLADILSRVEHVGAGRNVTCFISRQICQKAEFTGPRWQGKFQCGCGACNPDYWCKVPWCSQKRLYAKDYCEGHADAQLRQAEGSQAIVERLQGYWEKRAGELSVNPGGKEGFDQLRDEMRAHIRPTNPKEHRWYSIGEVLLGGILRDPKSA